jgi:hypothetical protein
MTPQEKLQKYFEKIVEDLGATVAVPVKTTIYAINEDRRLLALRGYLRYPQLNRGGMEDNWAWTDEKEQTFNRSPQKTEFDGEVAKVKREFRKLKPGYYLTGEVKARSLETQIRLWNSNKPMKDIVSALNRSALREIARTSGNRTNPTLIYADDPAAADIELFKTGWTGCQSNQRHARALRSRSGQGHRFLGLEEGRDAQGEGRDDHGKGYPGRRAGVQDHADGLEGPRLLRCSQECRRRHQARGSSSRATRGLALHLQ